MKNANKTEERPIFIMIGENKDGEFEIKPTKFFPVSNRNHKAVVIGVITKGGVGIGDELILKNSSHVNKCTIGEIQKNKTGLIYAVSGETVGVLLKGIKIQQIRRVNEARE